MVALALDYHAIDDVIRTAQAYRARYLYINRIMKASFQDVIAEKFSEADPGFELVEFGRAGADSGWAGIYPGREAVRLVTEKRRVYLVNDVEAAPVVPPLDGRETWLVIGHRWRPTESDLELLYRRGYGRIVCSKFELIVSDRDTIRADGGKNVPDNLLYDIDAQGPIELHP